VFRDTAERRQLLASEAVAVPVFEVTSSTLWEPAVRRCSFPIDFHLINYSTVDWRTGRQPDRIHHGQCLAQIASSGSWISRIRWAPVAYCSRWSLAVDCPEIWRVDINHRCRLVYHYRKWVLAFRDSASTLWRRVCENSRVLFVVGVGLLDQPDANAVDGMVACFLGCLASRNEQCVDLTHAFGR